MHACEHCGTTFLPRAGDHGFCCRGCEYVAELIHNQGFGRFYELKRDKAGSPVRSRPFESHDFSWILPAVAAAETQTQPGVAGLECAVEGISCVGCVWLIDRLFQACDGALLASANPARGTLHLEWQKGRCDIEGFARRLTEFGYVMAPASLRARASEGRGLVGRMGLCGAFALNAMGFSLPVYLGMPADFEFAGLFRGIAFASATMAMLVGGGYFASRAWRSLKLGLLHIDLPIALGLVAAYLGSIAGWMAGEERLVYFDFVATFVFLMLLGRGVQLAAVERNRLRLVRRSPLPETVEAGNGELPLALITPGTVFLLEAGKALPVSSVIQTGIAEVSLEWINGEADPVTLHPGSRIPGGAILLSRGAVSVTADDSWENSLISKLVAGHGADPGSPVFQRLLRIYLTTIVLLGFGVFAGWTWVGAWRPGLQAMISVFVVSCPCALGVALPLADEWAAARLARSGAFVRRATLWPRLRRVKHVILDKTGTLTLERPILENPLAVAALDSFSALALARLTQASLHPISRTLLEALGSRGQHLLKTIGSLPTEETPGEGVHCTAEDGEWFLGKGPGGTELRKDGSVIAAFTFRDSLRPGAIGALGRLQGRGLSLHILSGDSPRKVELLARDLRLPEGAAIGGLSPGEKFAKVKGLDRRDTLYLGDGANDSLAFDAAFVTGTPVVDRSLLEAKSDFYAMGSGLAYLPEAFATADARACGVRRAFIFALIYNLAVVGLAASARMSPLLAAILMPLSSLFSILLVASGFGRTEIAYRPEKSHDRNPASKKVRVRHESAEQPV